MPEGASAGATATGLLSCLTTLVLDSVTGTAALALITVGTSESIRLEVASAGGAVSFFGKAAIIDSRAAFASANFGLASVKRGST
jgi:hypothetical protein